MFTGSSVENSCIVVPKRTRLLYIYPVYLYTYPVVLVYRYRVKSLSGLLNKQSRAVNYVWNYCNDTQKHALKWNSVTAVMSMIATLILLSISLPVRDIERLLRESLGFRPP